MPLEPDPESLRDEVILKILEALEGGRDIDPESIIATHPELVGDLESFLASHRDLARLTAPFRGSRRAELGDGLPGIGAIGDFRLLREVGRGGMGVVYEAMQVSLRRRVALKVMPFADALDPRRLQRFRAEAWAAAHLHHERIVPVYAIGSERGIHYFAMQFVEGQSLSMLIGELWRLEDARALSPPQDNEASRLVATEISSERSSNRRRYFERVAGLCRQAALGLEYAHQAGIVHRDVKPSNLLLDLRGQLWITDFGLAQVAGDTGLTMTGEMLGTLRYASPEQLLARRGIVDHRSDVYSLGATLYELLTLRPPFDGKDRNELIRQVEREEPPPPGSLDPAIPRDLETIVLKALRKEPSERYATAEEFADDLQRFVEGRPIEARRPTASERLRAWSRRHPSIFGAGVVVLVLVSIASLVSAALIRQEQGKTLVARKKAEAAYRRERQRAEEAEARFRLARRAVDELIEVSEEELAHVPGMGGLRKRLLASVLGYYREFIDERRSDPDAQVELRDTSRRVETILADLAVLRAAGDLYLLIQPSALDDLRLDDSQRSRVAELSARAGKNWMESFGEPSRLPPPSERERLALEQARANKAEVDRILSPVQQGRLRQLALQSEGPAAFREPEVVQALRLSPSQRERIRTIDDLALVRPGEPARPAAMSRILAQLSPEQLRRWDELIGEPIRGRLSAFPWPIEPQPEAKSPDR
ncbi:protein kinase domain-containing protein [Singulisphaera sp. PoT]|uniref:protein kinase domain-containing protein n=1 Tax=Singulisphaera sp. PoT TaxID=3411797 RepID=UPI003BF5A2AC